MYYVHIILLGAPRQLLNEPPENRILHPCQGSLLLKLLAWADHSRRSFSSANLSRYRFRISRFDKHQRTQRIIAIYCINHQPMIRFSAQAIPGHRLLQPPRQARTNSLVNLVNKLPPAVRSGPVDVIGAVFQAKLRI